MADKREKFGWAMFDFANSGYTTVILTAIFNTYFVGVIAQEYEHGSATFLWTITIAIANTLVLITAPVIGAISDYSNNKKKLLLFTTVSCVVFTALLYFTGPGNVILSITLVILSSIMFFSGENLIAAFLPEITTPDNMGKLSGYGWTLGYIGGLIVLGLCLVYVNWAQEQQQTAEQFVPITVLIVAFCFAISSLPTFLWLKERKSTNIKPLNKSYFQIGFSRLRDTWSHARKYQDLFRFLITLMIYHCGINTVVILAAVYAQEVMKFTTQETILLILVVNITAAIGAFIFGFIQDKIGSTITLQLTLFIWIFAAVLAFSTESVGMFWIVANLVGIALGSSQSAGRALVGMFSPPEKNGEFFGLWGLATKLSAVIGPLVYGFITYMTNGNHRLALLSTIIFFLIGVFMLRTVDETRGIQAAHQK